MEDATDEFLKTIDYTISQRAKQQNLLKSEKKKQLEKKQITTPFQLKKLKQKYNIEQAKKSAKLELEKQKRGQVQTSVLQASVQQAKANQRQRIIGNVYSKAEQMELWAVSLNETPLLHSMETVRMNQTTPPDRSMTRIIKEISDSFPD